MSKGVVDFFTKTAVSAARSLLLSQVKGGVKSFIDAKKARTIQDVHQEMMKSIGYTTSHYTLQKTTQAIVYKSSGLFLHEFLTHSPLVKEKLSRDEENGQAYLGKEALTNEKKVELLTLFVEATGIKTPSVSTHFDQAIKLVDTTDFTSAKFKQHFAGWKPDNVSLIDNWMTNCFGVEDEFSNMLFRKWIIGTAKRIMEPGCLLDGAFTLKGPGAVGKTSFFRRLLPEEFNGRSTEIYCNPRNPQKFVENIIGKSICCFDELQVLDYARSVETFKQILTSQTVNVRLAYRRDPTNYRLRCGFAATTNRDQFINDPFLSRRLWLVELTGDQRLNFDYLAANQHAMWQEAVYRASNKENYFLSNEERALLEERNTKYVVK